MSETGLATPAPDDFEDVWLFAYYPTNGQIDNAMDRLAKETIAGMSAKFVGSGAMLVPPFERDLQWKIRRGWVEKASAALRKQGFRVEVRDIPPRETA